MKRQPGDGAPTLAELHECLEGARDDIRTLDGKLNALGRRVARSHTSLLIVQGQLKALCDNRTMKDAEHDAAFHYLREANADVLRAVRLSPRGTLGSVKLDWKVGLTLAGAASGLFALLRGVEAAWPSLIAALHAIIHG